MEIFVGADHRGFELKTKILAHLKATGRNPIDVGTFDDTSSCDYPVLSKKVGQDVVTHAPHAKGILLCMTGIGHSIAANKIPGVYAALVYNKEAAILSRQHNDANVLVLGSKFVSEEMMCDIIDVWLTTPFEGGRHLRRTDQIKVLEKEFLK